MSLRPCSDSYTQNSNAVFSHDWTSQSAASSSALLDAVGATSMRYAALGCSSNDKRRLRSNMIRMGSSLGSKKKNTEGSLGIENSRKSKHTDSTESHAG